MQNKMSSIPVIVERLRDMGFVRRELAPEVVAVRRQVLLAARAFEESQARAHD